MPLVVVEYNYYFLIKVLEPEESSKMILPVKPSMGKWNRATYMEVIKFFVCICTFSSSINKDNVLAGEAQEWLQGISILIRALSLNSRWLCVVNAEKALGKRSELLFWFSCYWSLVESYLVRELMNIPRISIVKICTSIIKSYSIFLLDLSDKLSLCIFFIQEFC